MHFSPGASPRSGPVIWLLQVCTASLLFFASHAVAAPFAYITNSGSNTVSVIDIATNTVFGAPISVGAQPYGVAADTQGTRVYVTNQGSNSVSVIDTATNAVVATIAVGANPQGIAVNAAGTRVYVVNGKAVSVIDTASNTVLATSAVIDGVNLALNAVDTRLYVTTATSGVAVIDTATMTVITVLPDPSPTFDEWNGVIHAPIGGIAVDPTSSRVYVTYMTNPEGPLFPIGRIIDGQTNQFLPGGIRAGWSGLAVDPQGRSVFSAWGGVWRFDVLSSVVSYGGFGGPGDGAGGAVDPTGSRYYVVNPYGKWVSVVDTATLQQIGAPIEVGSNPVAMGLFIGPGPSGTPALPTGCTVTVQSPTLPFFGGSDPVAANCSGGDPVLEWSWVRNGLPLLSEHGSTLQEVVPANLGLAPVTYTYRVTPCAVRGCSAPLTTSLVVGTAPAAASFTNLGFEAPSLGGGYQYAPAGAGWSFSPPAGVSGNGNAFTSGNPAAPEGTQVGVLQIDAKAVQVVPLSVGLYSVSFKAAQRANYQQGVQSIELYVDGVLAGTCTPPDASYTLCQMPAFAIVSPGNHAIALGGAPAPGAGDVTAFIDDVRIEAASPSALSNAGFESPPLGNGFAYRPVGANWNFTASSGIAGNASAFTADNPAAPEGTQVGFLQLKGALSQTPTLLTGLYSITFAAAQRTSHQSRPQIIDVRLDGLSIAQCQPAGITYSVCQTLPFSIGTPGGHTLTLAGIASGSDFTAFIDDVRLQAVPAGPLANLGFESPAVGNGSAYAPSSAGWTFDRFSGVTGNGSPFTAANPLAPEGSQVGFLQVHGSMAQTASVSAGTYSVSFQAAQRGNWQNGTQVIDIRVDGVSMGLCQPASTAYTLCQSGSFSLGAGEHTLALVGVGNGGSDYTAFIDDVRMNSGP